jgi:hypothetical protein
MRSWLSGCQLRHTACPHEYGAAAPTRLVDVENLRVINGSACGPALHYATLSYCWGSGSFARTTTRNLASFQTGIDVHYLPQNIQDALFVTRKLGLKYIWIDSLCVIQDDPNDWGREIKNIGYYYRFSSVSISILSEPGVLTGFLKPRNDRNAISLANGLHIRKERPSWSEIFENAPLSKRAWILQERLMAPRIIHFEKNEIMWECFSASAREGTSKEHSEAWQGNAWTDESFKRSFAIDNIRMSTANTNHDQANHKELLMAHWYRILCQYTTLSMTFARDIFPAISGIAQKFYEATQFTYLAGLWYEHLHTGLLWYADSSNQSDVFKTLAPSWSWASLGGPVKMIYGHNSCAMTTQFDAEIQHGLNEIDSKNQDFTTPSSLEITLNAYSFIAWCRSSSNGNAPYSDPYLRMVVDIFNEQGVFVGTGYLDKTPQDNVIQCTAIVVSCRRDHDFGSQPVTYFLLVERFDGDDKATIWTRLGIGQTTDTTHGHNSETLYLENSQKGVFLLC